MCVCVCVLGPPYLVAAGASLLGIKSPWLMFTDDKWVQALARITERTSPTSLFCSHFIFQRKHDSIMASRFSHEPLMVPQLAITNPQQGKKRKCFLSPSGPITTAGKRYGSDYAEALPGFEPFS